MRADALAKRQALLEATWTLMAERGPDVPLRTVAEQAGVGIGTLYRHFPTRDDLLIGLLDDFGERVTAIIDDHLARWDEDPAEVWRGFVTSLADLGFGEIAFQIGPLAVASTALGTHTRKRRDRMITRLSRALDAARTAGLLRDDVRPEQFMVTLATLSRPLPPQVTELVPDHRRWMVEVLLRGLRAEG